MTKVNGLSSQNGKSYAQLDFTLITEKGLKPLTDALNKNGVKIENIAASNRATKKNGLSVKTATLRAQDGQEIQIEVNDSGDFSGFKLNGKPIPTVQTETIAKIASSLATAVKKNSKKFNESLARKAKRVIDTSGTKPAVKSNVQRLKEAKTRTKEIADSVQELQAIVTSTTKQKAEMSQRVQDAQNRLSSAKALTTQLQDQLKKLEVSNA